MSQQRNSQSKLDYVTKRNGKLELISFDKITQRIKYLCEGLDMDFVNPAYITTKIVNGMYNEISTKELDEYAANFASTLTVEHPDYAILAGRIASSNLQKETYTSFSNAMQALHDNLGTNKEPKPLIADDVYEIIMANKEKLNAAIVPKRDFDFTYFGFRTLQRAYLLKVKGRVVETPQYMFMRVAVGIHKEDIDSAIETYNYMSDRWFTHATPTLFNGGRPRPQLSSCFLLSMVDDSIDGIYTTLQRCAMISKYGGGIGVNLHNIRATGSSIDGTDGVCTGIVPMLKNFNATATYVNQGGKRPGAFAMYLEPWHADIEQFVQLRLNVGPEEVRCRDLFIALWVPDLFMRRVELDLPWSLMCPDECPGLSDCWGEKFEELYEQYEQEGRFRRQMKARDLFRIIIASQCETGLPYMLFKDTCNRKSNQKNLGTIKCSNLCTEIIEYTNSDEVAVCNLASIALNRFVVDEETYDFEKLRQVSKVVAKNLNKVIDINFYPIEEAKTSNLRHRPIGIGVQGLADTFALMRTPFTSPKARKLNKQIFETIYFGALEASCELAEKFGAYESYEGSPVSKGILQFDMWEKKPCGELNLNWSSLRERIAKFGVRNSLLVAPMPTASTAQILGNNEAFEPFTSNLYTRRVTKGDFQVVNQYLIRDLIKLGKWNPRIRDQIIMANGSVKMLDELPKDFRDLYKTVWELKQSDLIEMAADRGPFIDQSQSLNLFVESPNFGKCTSLHFKAWHSGLKTGMYYLRSKPSVNPVKFSVSKRRTLDCSMDEGEEVKKRRMLDDLDGTPRSHSLGSQSQGRKVVEQVDEGCLMCSS